MLARERMDPGGSRGLQIPRSGALRVRGGFDSHTFPPLVVALWGLLLGVPRLVTAQPQPMPADTMIVEPTFGEPGPRPVEETADSASIRTFGPRA